MVQIRAVYVANRGAYGWPRVWRALRAQGIRVGKQRVQKLMRQQNYSALAASGVSASPPIADMVCRSRPTC